MIHLIFKINLSKKFVSDSPYVWFEMNFLGEAKKSVIIHGAPQWAKFCNIVSFS